MQEDVKRIYHFHSDANSLGGFIEEPFEKIIPSQASVSLPVVGGYAHTRTEAFNFQEVVSCRAAYTRVSGKTVKKNGPWSTLVTSVIEGLNILEIVKAERVVAQISVEHPEDGGLPKVFFGGSHFEKLRVAGCDVNLSLHPRLLTLHSGERSLSREDNPHAQGIEWSKFVEIGQNQSRVLSETPNVPKWAMERYGWMASRQGNQGEGFALCSLVDRVDGVIPGESFGHVVEVPDFGRIFLGELIIHPRATRLTMIRAELGCNVKGQVTAASGGAQGSTVPPS